MIVLHQGLNENKHILNKTTLIELAQTNSKTKTISRQFIDNIKAKIEQFYGSDYEQIVVYGDGAKFIKRLAKAFNAKYILDKFHLLRKLFLLCGFNKYNTENKRLFIDYLVQNSTTLFAKIRDLLLNNQAQEALFLLENEFENRWNSLSKLKQNQYMDFIKYIKNNRQFIIHYNIGSHTESLICHQIKKNGTKKFTTYGIETFKKILIFNLNERENLLFI
ncbi:hypothetical protein NPA11_01080 [Mycoplasma sp. 1578d]|nr:hypothetical protein [Mycoplasma sp. 1578d]UUM20016.1 hypothetical protein NPA11_01080 [Mycoplasma sp. 1578d]